MFSPGFRASDKVDEIIKLEFLLEPLNGHLAAYTLTAIKNNGLVPG